MLYVVAYDITDDRRRRHLAGLLEGHGERVQRSVFEVDVATPALPGLLDAAEKHLAGPADDLRFYRLCAGCRDAAYTRGGAGPGQREIAWFS